MKAKINDTISCTKISSICELVCDFALIGLLLQGFKFLTRDQICMGKIIYQPCSCWPRSNLFCSFLICGFYGFDEFCSFAFSVYRGQRSSPNGLSLLGVICNQTKSWNDAFLRRYEGIHLGEVCASENAKFKTLSLYATFCPWPHNPSLLFGRARIHF